MRRFLATMALLAAFWGVGDSANAAVYTDDLSKCLVRSAGPADQKALIVWIFGAMSVHPDIQGYAKMTSVERQAVSKSASLIMQRLMTVDCRAETVAALKYEGDSAIEAAFGVLGGVAMKGLMGDATVGLALAELGTYSDAAAFEALAAEAAKP